MNAQIASRFNRVFSIFCVGLFGILSLRAQNQQTLSPGDDIQQAVDSSPENTTFILQPGIYRLQSIQPRNGDSFIGQPGAVLNGSTLLTSFAPSGNLWMTMYALGQNPTQGLCAPDHPRCSFDEDLFFDNRPLLHVDSVQAVTSGTYFIDYAQGNLYLGDDPTGHTVEVATAQSAFGGPAANVTIKGLTVEKYASPAQFGAIGNQNPGPGWVISNNEVRLNHGTGLSLGAGAQATQNNVHDNGERGVGGAAENILLDSNEIARNNYAGFEVSWEAGGAKFGATTGLVMRNNYVHDNAGPGLWCDSDCMNTLIEGNTIINNTRGPGIQYEISYNATIRNNTVRYNHVPDSGWWMWGSQILLQNSMGCEVYGNTVDVDTDGNAIGLMNQNRGSGPYGLRAAMNNYIHDNTIITRHSPQGGTGLVADYDEQNISSNGNNRFDSDTFHVSDPSAYQWAWGAGMTWTEFQAAGQEQHGVIDNAVPPPPQ